MIPRLVHQVWVRSDRGDPAPPARLDAAAATWRELEPDWTYRLWRDEELDDLFARLRPDLLELYRSYPYAVQRADAGRYLVLHEFGGVYADVDVARAAAAERLDALRDHPVVLAPTEPLGVSIDFMMAEPGHPVFRRALDGLARARARWGRRWIPRHFRVMAGTGSLYLTRVLQPTDDVHMLTTEEYGHGSPEAALVRHLPGNTWAGWDTHAFVFVSDHWRALTAAAAVVAVAAATARVLR